MIVTRFAPSPTGQLHLGHAYSAVLAHARARAARGKFLLRIEDLDAGRCRPEYVTGILQDLGWLGLDHQSPMLVQSRRSAVYAEALDRLRALRLVYPCFCTRSDIAEALAAPHGKVRAHYPGTCRGLRDDPERRRTQAHSWRLDAAAAVAEFGPPDWTEDGRVFASSEGDFDDVVLARKDTPAAYHLACVVDDAASGVTLVVRGEDLRASTPVQRLLQQILDLPEPRYLHHRLVVHDDGRRLAKRDLAPTLSAMRAGGADGPALAGQLRTGAMPGDFRLADA